MMKMLIGVAAGIFSVAAFSFPRIELSTRAARASLPPSMRQWIRAHPCLPEAAWKTPGTDVAWLVELHCGGESRVLGVLKKSASTVRTIDHGQAPYGSGVIAVRSVAHHMEIRTRRSQSFVWKGGSFQQVAR